MNRRSVITLLGGAAAAWPPAARAQRTEHIPKVGVLWHAANEQQGLFKPGDELHIHATGVGSIVFATIYYTPHPCP
jgi:hypothetical protein